LFGGVADQKRTVSDAISHWLSVKEATVAHSTFINYRSKAKTHILPMFGSRPLRTITKTEVEQWATLYLSDLKNKTINEVMIVFRGIFKDALADGVVKVNPVALIENRKVLKQAPDPFTKAEIDRILKNQTRQGNSLSWIFIWKQKSPEG